MDTSTEIVTDEHPSQQAEAKKVKFDANAFETDLKSARDETKPSEAEDAHHLAGIERWTTGLGVVSLALFATGGISPIGMFAMAYRKYAKFAILAHHSLHGGWGRRRRGWFASGYRRLVDWMDWILPEAWIAEHNKVHHYRLNEDADPDFVQRNLAEVRNLPLPQAVKWMIMFFFIPSWKYVYYASNTLKLVHKDRREAPPAEWLEEQHTLTRVFARLFSKWSAWYRLLALDLAVRAMGPVVMLHYVLPAIFMGILRGITVGGYPLCWVTLVNLVGAELINNSIGFITIVTNHAGSDLWWFKDSCKADCAEFYLRAILGSTAYTAGTDVIDYMHGYLNYQCEHHSFPDLSPLHYQRLHPRFKHVCAKHCVPYVQESVFIRSKKTLDIMMGFAEHKKLFGQAVDQPLLWMVATG